MQENHASYGKGIACFYEMVPAECFRAEVRLLGLAGIYVGIGTASFQKTLPLLSLFFLYIDDGFTLKHPRNPACFTIHKTEGRDNTLYPIKQFALDGRRAGRQSGI